MTRKPDKSKIKDDFLFLDHIHHSRDQPITLSKRQAEIIFFLMRGKTVKAIALILNISPRTVDEHLKYLRFKFKAANKSELIARVISNEHFKIFSEHWGKKNELEK